MSCRKSKETRVDKNHTIDSPSKRPSLPVESYVPPNKQHRYWTLELGAGHLLVWFFEALTQCYTSRAQGVFAYQLRGSVMRSLVQQDYEYSSLFTLPIGAGGSLAERRSEDLGDP